MKKICYLVVALMMIFFVTSCSKEKYINLSYKNTELELIIGDKVSVKPDAVVGNKVKNYKLEYSLSSDIATIDGEGMLTAEKVGTATLTVTANNKDKSSTSIQIVIKEKEYVVTFDLNEGLMDQTEMSFTDATKVTLPTPTKVGYKFIGWYENDILITSLENRNYHLIAKWDLNVYTLTLNPNEGILDETEMNFTDATKVTLPTPTKVGYEFLGWYEGETLITSLENRNYNLVAKWDVASYIMTFVDEESNVLFTKEYKYMENVTLEEFQKDGYYFDGWFIDGIKCEQYIMGLENITVTGKFTKKVIVNVYFGNGEENQIIETRAGNTLSKLTELKVPSYAGYRFDDFYYDEDFTSVMKPNLKLSEDINLYVKWLKLYVITYELNGGSVNDELLSEYVAEDLLYTDVELKQPYKEGYYFRGWYTNPNYQGDLVYKFQKGTEGDIFLYARWIEASLENAFVSVIGDSNSAYEGVLPSGFTPCYLYTKQNGIFSIDKMWWNVAKNAIGYKNGIINAYAGTTVMSEYGSTYATELKSRLRRSIPANKIGPEIVIIYMGTNDCLVEGLNIANFEDAYRTMILNLYELLPTVQIFVCNIAYEVNKVNSGKLEEHLERKAAVNNTIAKLATEFNIPLIDFASAYDRDTDDYDTLYDTIHPTAFGQSLLGAKVIEAFKEFYGLE